MSPSSDIDAATADPDAERAARHAAALEELTEIGLELARGLRGQTGEARATSPWPSRACRAPSA